MSARTPNAWSIFRRDVGRLARVSKAWIIIIGVIVTPSLYAWFNIVAFWDPYGNTEHVSVAIVNQDEGAESEVTGTIDVGGELVAQLEDNDQLGWEFVDEDEAMDAVRSGDSYAAIVIPADFSRDLISITTGDFVRPELKYYVNEKANAIAPKITDVGASTLDRQINSSFVSVVTEAITDQLRGAGEDAQERLADARDGTISALDSAVGKVGSARDRITDLQTGLDDAQGKLDDAAATLTKVDATMGQVQTAIADAQKIADEAQQGVLEVTDSVTSAYVEGATLLADAASTMNGSVAKVSAGLQQAGVAVGTAVDDLTAVVETNGEALERLQAVLDDAEQGSEAAERLSDAIADLRERNAADQKVLDELSQLNSDIGDTIAAVSDASDAVDSAAGNAANAAGDIRDALTGSVPQLNSALSALSSSASAFSSALGAQRGQVTQAQGLLGDLGDQLASTSTALGSLDDNLATAQRGLGDVRGDVLALSAADVWDRLATITGLDPDDIAHFMASPVEVSENVLFPTSTYGSAMAPLFTNLSLWIGAFVLMVIFRREVDTEGVEGVTVRQAYLGRWMLFAALAFFQAVLVSVGNLVIGVQTANPVAFVGTSVLIGLAYLSIIYALSVCFGVVGMGLCILLVVVQIPGASGLYPIEMMPGFFQGLYPFLPFTYGIDALREVVSGFYGGHWWLCMGVLAIYVVLAFAVGLFLRGRLGNFSMLFNRRLAETDLMISEDVQVTSRRRTPEIIRALTDGDGYRARAAQRARRFAERHGRRLQITLIVGIAGLMVIAVCAWLLPDAKAPMLGLGTLWCVVVIAAFVALEYVKQSIDQAVEVSRMPDAELRRALRVERSGVLAPSAADAAAGAAVGATSTRTLVLDVPDGEAEPGTPVPDEPVAEEPDDGTAVLEGLLAEADAAEPEPEPDEPAADAEADATTLAVPETGSVAREANPTDDVPTEIIDHPERPDEPDAHHDAREGRERP